MIKLLRSKWTGIVTLAVGILLAASVAPAHAQRFYYGPRPVGYPYAYTAAWNQGYLYGGYSGRAYAYSPSYVAAYGVYPYYGVAAAGTAQVYAAQGYYPRGTSVYAATVNQGYLAAPYYANPYGYSGYGFSYADYYTASPYGYRR